MLIRRLLENFRARGRPAAESPITSRDRVQSLPGFNVLVRGRHGLFLANENDIYVGRALIDYGEYSELEWRFLERYCAPGNVVVEIGANVGSHTVGMAKSVGAGGRLVAIEPQPFVFQTLCANLALNCLLNVDVFNCACGADEGTLAFKVVDYSSPGNFGGVELRSPDTRPAGIEVPVRRLDSLLRPYTRVDLLKIDVEGMEDAVLEGARETIARFRPVLYLENDRIEKSQALIELVRALGYRAWWHTPLLFNPANFFGNADDRYPGIASFNMVCLYGNAEPSDGRELSLVEDSAFHPLKAIAEANQARRD